jgi:hypothetical protein
MARLGGPVRVFVSYSHDSHEHTQRVRAVSDRLRKDGIDCHIDQYEAFPPDGWPAWMQRQIEEADFVLCVGSEAYRRRMVGGEQAGVGAGAKWEGAIISQRLYEAEGKNEKFIPLVFGRENIRHIPPFLVAFTHFDLAGGAGYDALYRLLTNQPAISKPPLGQLRDLPTAPASDYATAPRGDPRDYSSMALIFAPDLGMHFVDAQELVFADTIELKAKPFNPEGGHFLESLRRARRPIGVSHGLASFQATVMDVRQTVRAGSQEFKIVLRPDESDYGAGILEMSIQGLSPDRIAELRARRILLDERLEQNGSNDISMMNDATLEVFVRGINAPLSVEESPLPDVFTEIGRDAAFFVEGARLVSILWLRLSGVVEAVSKLEMRLSAPDVLDVDFVGHRSRKYVNSDRTRIAVSGQCRLVRG